MLLSATFWLTLTHTLKGNGPKLADWSKWVCITLQSCFCSLLTSTWEVNTGRSINSFLTIFQITQQFVISMDIEDIGTNLPIRKDPLRVFTWYFEGVVGKTSFGCLICEFFWFVEFCVTFNDLCCWTQRCGLLSRIHLRVTDQSWQTGPSESALHFKVVFILCWHQIGKLVQVVLNAISVILLKLHLNSW